MSTLETQSKQFILKPEGKITAANADAFRKELLDIVESGHTDLVIDLSKVDILDSKGLAVFIVCHKTLAARKGNLTVITHNDDFMNLFHVMRLDRHFTVKRSE
jgi:anti-anti-sigma factor